MANSCKYYKQVLQVSYDSGVTWVNVGETRKGDLYDYESMQCGGGVTQYRWVNVTGQYTCDGTTKYQKTKKQYSNDGTTWQDVSPAEYGKGDVIEYQSEDCGYEPPSYSGEYLTFVAIDDGRFKFNDNQNGNKVKYSLDEGSTWSTLASDTYSPTVYAGQKIMWKGELTPSTTRPRGIGMFSSTGRFNIEGNVMSLLYGDNFEGQTSLAGYNYAFDFLFAATSVVDASRLCLPATTLEYSCYEGMFQDCTSLTVAPELPATTLAEYCYRQMFCNCTSLTTAPELPATTLAERCYVSMFLRCSSLITPPALSATTLMEDCYGNMFCGCTSLTTAPELPATTLADKCYLSMFSGCTSLTVAPELPATTMADFCYGWMFDGCTSLTTAPELPATTMASRCYQSMFIDCTSLTTAPVLSATTLEYECYEQMFNGCTSLNYIKCLATDISAEDCTLNWVYGVSSSGTFVKNSLMNDWTRGSSGIPNNWTVQNA